MIHPLELSLIIEAINTIETHVVGILNSISFTLTVNSSNHSVAEVFRIRTSVIDNKQTATTDMFCIDIGTSYAV